MRDRYTIAVGLVFFAVVVIAILHQAGDNGGILGLDRQPPHWPLPEFAVPLASQDSLEGDANVAQDDCGSSRLPCPDPRTPACQVEEPGAFRVCELFGRPSLISFWFTKSGGDCVEQQDIVSQVYERYRGRVGFISLDVHDDPATVRDLLHERGWKMPVGYDRDGAVGALYRVAGCPTFAFAYPGGTLWRATTGVLTAAELSAHLEQLLEVTHAAERGGAGA